MARQRDIAERPFEAARVWARLGPETQARIGAAALDLVVATRIEELSDEEAWEAVSDRYIAALLLHALTDACSDNGTGLSDDDYVEEAGTSPPSLRWKLPEAILALECR